MTSSANSSHQWAQNNAHKCRRDEEAGNAPNHRGNSLISMGWVNNLPITIGSSSSHVGRTHFVFARACIGNYLIPQSSENHVFLSSNLLFLIEIMEVEPMEIEVVNLASFSCEQQEEQGESINLILQIQPNPFPNIHGANAVSGGMRDTRIKL